MSTILDSLQKSSEQRDDNKQTIDGFSFADKNNNPAPYSEDNVPYTPKHFLPVSLDGVEEGDFTLVFGFPGRTNEYLPSPAVAQIVDVLNPAKIKVRETALKIMDVAMKADKQIKIQYASKYAGISNYWKKWIGESLGLKLTNAVAKKQKFEQEFTKRVRRKRKFRKKYKDLLPQFAKLYKAIAPYSVTEDIYYETFYRNTDITKVANYLDRLVTLQDDKNPGDYEAYKARIKRFLGGFYKNYSPKIDQDVFAALMAQFNQTVEKRFVNTYMQQLAADNKGDFKKAKAMAKAKGKVKCSGNKTPEIIPGKKIKFKCTTVDKAKSRAASKAGKKRAQSASGKQAAKQAAKTRAFRSK